MPKVTYKQREALSQLTQKLNESIIDARSAEAAYMRARLSTQTALLSTLTGSLSEHWLTPKGKSQLGLLAITVGDTKSAILALGQDTPIWYYPHIRATFADSLPPFFDETLDYLSSTGQLHEFVAMPDTGRSSRRSRVEAQCFLFPPAEGEANDKWFNRLQEALQAAAPGTSEKQQASAVCETIAAVTERLRGLGSTPATQTASDELFGMASQFFQLNSGAGRLDVWAKSYADFLEGVGLILCPALRNRAQVIRHTD